MEDKEKLETLAELITRGGIFYDVEGNTKKEVMSNVINSLPAGVLKENKRASLLQAVIEREALISTGIENGIALPHPRTPVLCEGELPFVTIAFPALPLDWGTPDNSLVTAVFLIVSRSAKQHLNVLTKTNFLCMEKEFYRLLSARAAKEKIIAAVEEAEKKWR